MRILILTLINFLALGAMAFELTEENDKFMDELIAEELAIDNDTYDQQLLEQEILEFSKEEENQ